MLGMTEFMLASLLMGLGIGADVAVATLFRTSLTHCIRMRWFWIIGVTVTHTIFPMFGYLLTYFSLQSVPVITPLIGLLASGCIAYYLWQSFLADGGDDHNSSLLVTLGLILAVSWDALWSGPAKSAQVIDWPTSYVWSSFLIAGVVVLIMALAGAGLAKKLTSALYRHKLALVGDWLQCTVIAYFGILALARYTLGLEVSAWWFLLCSAILAIALVRVKHAQPIQREDVLILP